MMSVKNKSIGKKTSQEAEPGDNTSAVVNIGNMQSDSADDGYKRLLQTLAKTEKLREYDGVKKGEIARQWLTSICMY